MCYWNASLVFPKKPLVSSIPTSFTVWTGRGDRKGDGVGGHNMWRTNCIVSLFNTTRVRWRWNMIKCKLLPIKHLFEENWNHSISPPIFNNICLKIGQYASLVCTRVGWVNWEKPKCEKICWLQLVLLSKACIRFLVFALYLSVRHYLI